MAKGLSFSSPNPRAAVESDSDYFATETHCLSLVNRIDGALRAGGRLVLVTGDPPPAPQLLTQALPEATESRYAVVDTQVQVPARLGGSSSAGASVGAESMAPAARPRMRRRGILIR